MCALSLSLTLPLAKSHQKRKPVISQKTVFDDTCIRQVIQLVYWIEAICKYCANRGIAHFGISTLHGLHKINHPGKALQKDKYEYGCLDHGQKTPGAFVTACACLLTSYLHIKAQCYDFVVNVTKVKYLAKV